MQTEFFEVTTDPDSQVFINLALVFRVAIEHKGGSSVVTFFFLSGPEPSASYRVPSDRVKLLIERFT
ncbi:hypothetical protein R5W23_006170 [Gemmata sp. JC673]|uniref:Uncharacterized protein n=1 Tax=Gemmata algarum TaxID=2975278 RepID=A0ABU5EUY4_9BACT|nr:hypothetical protein [Gemmata algarum]MDY3558980.1 hypothetical protein [Gemmata algarum]